MFIKSEELKFTLLFVLASIVMRILSYTLLRTPTADDIMIDAVGLVVAAICVFSYLKYRNSKNQ